MVTGVVPSPPPARAFVPIAHIGFISIPLARRFSSNVAINMNSSSSRAFRYEYSFFFCKKKSLRELALGENRTHETDLSRDADHLPSHRGRRWYK